MLALVTENQEAKFVYKAVASAIIGYFVGPVGLQSGQGPVIGLRDEDAKHPVLVRAIQTHDDEFLSEHMLESSRVWGLHVPTFLGVKDISINSMVAGCSMKHARQMASRRPSVTLPGMAGG